eukprot:6492714-Amphidinium_carterae.4
MPLVESAVKAVHEAIKVGARVIWEWPHKLSGWSLELIQAMLHSLPYKTRIDGCSYGLTYKGRPCRKPWLLHSSMPLPGLERLCACTQSHIPCEGGTHVKSSSRFSEPMVRSAVRAILKGLAQVSPLACESETVACGSETDEEIGFNRDGMLDDILSSDEAPEALDDVLSVSDDDGGDDETMRDLFGDDDEDEDEEVETGERTLPEPDVERMRHAVLNPQEQLIHEENGHYPKSQYCLVCQLADGPLHQHRKLHRSEVGMLAVDLAGPLYPDRHGNKYIVVAVWVGPHNHKSVALPFVELVTSRLATEVFESITKIVNQLENIVLSVLPSIDHGVPRVNGLRVLRLHTDRAREFLGSVAKTWAEQNKVLSTQTGSHSPQSNGRAENAIRVIKSVIRRSLVASGLSTEFWGFAARHAAELLRAYNLRKAGDKIIAQPLPFGSLVAVRRPGKTSSFKPFESRGKLGRLVLHEVSTRRCFILDQEGKLWKGFSAKPIVETCDEREDTIPEEFLGEGWTRVKLLTGRHAWFHPSDGLFRLTQPTLLDGNEVERVYEGDSDLFDQRSEVADCNTAEAGMVGESNSSSPDVSLVQEMISPDLPRVHAKSEVEPQNAEADAAISKSAGETKDDEESYCCNCGSLVWQRCDAVIDYCSHYACFDCRRSYVFDGANVWACLHHPELLLADGCQAVARTRKSSRKGKIDLCGLYEGSHQCKEDCCPEAQFRCRLRRMRI